MDFSLSLEIGASGNSRERRRELGVLGRFVLLFPSSYAITTVISRKLDSDWRDYTCIWHPSGMLLA
jgi:hypothetical protein